MNRLPSLRLVGSLALSVFAVWFIARQVRFDAVQNALAAVHGPLVLLALLALCAGFACRIAETAGSVGTMSPSELGLMMRIDL